MIICGSNYWNMTLSRDPGDVQNDAEGILDIPTDLKEDDDPVFLRH